MQHFAKEIVRRLVEAQVEFVVVGGFSAVLQGVPIVTLDLDICYRRTPENVARLAAALAPLQPRARGFPPDLPFFFDERTILLGSNFTLLIGDESLDLLPGLLERFCQAAFSRWRSSRTCPRRRLRPGLPPYNRGSYGPNSTTRCRRHVVRDRLECRGSSPARS